MQLSRLLDIDFYSFKTYGKIDFNEGVLKKLNFCILDIVYLVIVLYNDARAERALIFGLGTGCMAAAVLLRNHRLRSTTKLSPQIH